MRAPGSTRAAVALTAITLTAVTLSACERRPPPPAPYVVAEVEGQEVRWGDFQAYVENALGDSGDSLGSDVLSQLFDQFLQERLLALLAVERGLMSETSAAGRGRRVAVDVLLADAEESAPEITEAEVEAFYQQHRKEFERPPRVRLRQILTQDREAAEEALAEIRGGADFVEVAERLAEEGAARGAEAEGGVTAGGSLGELSREDLPPAFADTILELAPGQVSGVVEAEYGYHLFQVTEKLPAQTLPLEDARAEVERELRQRRADRLLGELVAEARRRYDVSVWERNLPFNYRGIHRADAV